MRVIILSKIICLKEELQIQTQAFNNLHHKIPGAGIQKERDDKLTTYANLGSVCFFFFYLILNRTLFSLIILSIKLLVF